MAAAFDLSYQDLTDGQQRLFRRLGLHLGTDIDPYAATVLDGTDLTIVRRHLEDLYDHYLLTWPTSAASAAAGDVGPVLREPKPSGPSKGSCSAARPGVRFRQDVRPCPRCSGATIVGVEQGKRGLLRH